MKIASIDVGTNSVRLLLTTYFEGHFHNSEKKIVMTRLGKGVNETGVLDFDRMRETVQVISTFKNDAENYGAENVYIMATSAVRDARNSIEFINWVKNETGLIIDIISGELEALIGFDGVLSTVKCSGQTLVIDIGGGSTELIVGTLKGVNYAQSYNMGAVRMTGSCIHSDPVSNEDHRALEARVSEIVNIAVKALEGFTFDEVVGIGGTAATYATMDLETDVYDRSIVQGHKVSLSAIKEINANLRNLSVEARKKIIGLESKRADIIYAGGIILEKILSTLGITSITFSDSDNLEGYILYNFKKMKDTN